MADELEYLLEFTQHKVFDLVPEIPVYVGIDDDVKKLHQLLQERTPMTKIEPPFWAFVWPGGQALARYTLDNPELVRGKDVLEIGPGSGINTIAAALAGAQSVETYDLEPMSIDLTMLNAGVHSVDQKIEEYATRFDGLIGDFDVILMGDCFYDGEAAYELGGIADAANAAGVPFIIGDPKREYTPVRRCTKLASYNVPGTMMLERRPSTPAFVYEVGHI